MARVKVQEKEGKFWADKLMDLNNLMGAALVFSQFTNPNPKLEIFLLGIALYIIFVILIRIIRKKL